MNKLIIQCSSYKLFSLAKELRYENDMVSHAIIFILIVLLYYSKPFDNSITRLFIQIVKESI